MKTIKHIFDGDFGCEEMVTDGHMVSVTLVDEHGEESYVSVEDEWLTAQGIDIGATWPEHLERIMEMEAIYTKATMLLKGNPAQLKEYKAEIKKLESYYTSPLWKEDFAMDEMGKLPVSLKRGVLSEDGVYNLLEELLPQI